MSRVEFLLSGLSALIIVHSSAVQSTRGLTNACSPGTNILKIEIPTEFIDRTIIFFFLVLEMVPRFWMLLKTV